jgi:hypothetical protein
MARDGSENQTERFCTEHRQTVGDDSARGEHYNDDRTRLAYVYSGLALRAVLFDRREVKRYREETGLTVSLTPAGECRLEGDCQEQPEAKP